MRCATMLVAIVTVKAAPADDDIRVMSFNIRFGTANDGENHWDRRRDFVVDTIQAFQPDLLGTQETLAFQRDYLAEKLAKYEPFGVGRDDGSEKGEMAAIFFRKERFEKLDGGNFWLSQTPDKPGSKSWDSSLPRIVTWIKLRDRKNPGMRPFVFLNTHFDHRGEIARLESARMIRQRIETEHSGTPTIVTGDFNASPTSEPYRALFGDAAGRPSRLIDTYRHVHQSPDNDEGTFSGFVAKPTRGRRIDWIACSREWEIVSAGIDRTQRAGRTPSDHFPVNAVVRPSQGTGASHP